MNFPSPTPALIVLDTNVALDWLLFRNPEFTPIETALLGGEVQWVATTAMRDELAHVLGDGRVAGRTPDLRAIWSHWDRHCVELPAPAGPRRRLRCTDPDDQMFIDLAIDAAVQWLVSRDRAVLKLARRLRDFGVVSIPPGAWRALTPVG